MNYDNEQWVNIHNFPTYAISDHGRVKNVKRDRVLKPVDQYGYDYVSLYIGGRQVNKRIHRLVAEAFIGMDPRENADQINHIDGIKKNNHVSNLEWNTSSENIKHAFDTGLKRTVNKRAVRIVQTGEVFDSLTACADFIGGSPGNIRNCITGRVKSHLGYTFEYVESEVINE